MTPTLLVGMPGCGQVSTRAPHRGGAARAFLPDGLGRHERLDAVAGHGRGWSTGQASAVIDVMLQQSCASALVLLDEIDKVGASSRNSVPPTVSAAEPVGTGKRQAVVRHLSPNDVRREQAHVLGHANTCSPYRSPCCPLQDRPGPTSRARRLRRHRAWRVGATSRWNGACMRRLLLRLRPRFPLKEFGMRERFGALVSRIPS